MRQPDRYVISMKTLYVLRHSKAGQTNKRILDDHERALTKKGHKLCHVVADYLQNMKASIPVVLSSTARRCVETHKYVDKFYPLEAKLELSPTLYLADLNEILRNVRHLDNAHGSALLIGHNPGLHEFCLSLMSGKSEKKLQKALKAHFSPPTLVTFTFETDDWKNLSFGEGLLTHYLRAKEML